MRLVKYLKVSRLIKRRTLAQEACAASRVEVNGRPQKPSYEVKTGDEILIRFGNKETRVRVLEIRETVRKEDAESMFEYL